MPVSTTSLVKQAELAQIVHEIQSQALISPRSQTAVGHSLQAIYTKLNTKLSLWYDTLPGELRWSRWSSSLEDVDPGHADLHMMYHTARLSLSRPLIKMVSPTCRASYNASGIALNASDSCEASVETILCIIGRFNAQHSLRAASLSFIHGAVAAADALLALAECRSGLWHTHFPALHDALGDMSQTWEIAADAGRGLEQANSRLGQPFQPLPLQQDFGLPFLGISSQPAADHQQLIEDAHVFSRLSPWQTADHIPLDGRLSLESDPRGSGRNDSGVFTWSEGMVSNMSSLSSSMSGHPCHSALGLF